MSHHKDIFIDVGHGVRIKIGYVRRNNDGTIQSVWISTDLQKKLFLPEEEK